MASTPNFNWSTPDNTGLVKNGALDIRTLGNAIDSSMADLKGGTTGQVLAKATNTDMDFTWVAQDDSNAIQNAIVDAKGDLIAATANDTPARLAVGADFRVLMGDSTQATGLKYGGEWVTYTPTLTNLTLGNGTLDARYRRVGQNIDVYIFLQLGSTSSITGYVGITLPFGGISGAGNTSYPNIEFVDSGVAKYIGQAFTNGACTLFELYPQDASSTYLKLNSLPMNATIPFTWGTSDYLVAQFRYMG